MDPDGRQSMPFASQNDYFNFWGNVIYELGNGLDKFIGLAMLDMSGADVTTEVTNLTSVMLGAMQELAGEAVIAGAQFMSDNGSTIALVAYASGNVGIGLTIDGITLLADAILIADEYNNTGDLTNAVIDITIIVASNAAGIGAGNKLANSMGLSKKALAEQLRPIVQTLVTSAASTGLDSIQEELND